jgi:hypothetical protein
MDTKWFGVESEKVSSVTEPILESAFQIVIEVALAGAAIDAVRVRGFIVLFAGTVLMNWYWYVLFERRKRAKSEVGTVEIYCSE